LSYEPRIFLFLYLSCSQIWLNPLVPYHHFWCNMRKLKKETLINLRLDALKSFFHMILKNPKEEKMWWKRENKFTWVPCQGLPFNCFHLGGGCHKGNQHKTSIRVANLHSNNIIWFGILLIPNFANTSGDFKWNLIATIKVHAQLYKPSILWC
jgi:hypothetical protein